MKSCTTENIAGSGLHLGPLRLIFKRSGEDGLVDVFSLKNSLGKPRVTSDKKVLGECIPKLCAYFSKWILLICVFNLSLKFVCLFTSTWTVETNISIIHQHKQNKWNTFIVLTISWSNFRKKKSLSKSCPWVISLCELSSMMTYLFLTTIEALLIKHKTYYSFQICNRNKNYSNLPKIVFFRMS